MTHYDKVGDISDNTYFDQTGKQILHGDLLKTFHFKNGKRTHYMYHVVVFERFSGFNIMAVKAHYAKKPHAKMFVLANNKQRVYHSAKIIAEKNWQTKRKKIKVE